MEMKGFSGIIVVVMMLLIVVVVLVSSDVVFFWEKGTTRNANIQATVYTMWNALRAAELYENISIDYAVYQACYDALRWGGFAEEQRNWSNSDDESEQPPTEKEFKQNFASLLRKYLNRYTREPYYFMQEYNVSTPDSSSLPEINITSLEMDYTGISLSAEADSKLYTKSNINEYQEEVVLMKSFSTKKHYDIPCLLLFAWGKGEHAPIRDGMRNQITLEMKRWPLSNHNVKSYSGTCRNINAEDEMFYQAAKDLLEENQETISFAEEESAGKNLPEWYNAVERGENRIVENLENAISSVVLTTNPEINLQPYVEVNAKITPNCYEEQKDGTCLYTCTKFEYDVTVTLKTSLMEKATELRTPRYYPVAPQDYPEFDRMHLVMTDRASYKG